jgi:hypothetical protein
MADDLKIGGASEALRDADSVIYLLLSHHIHRLSCDTHKQSVTVQKFVRRLKYATEAVKYQALVWPAQMRGFGLVDAEFKYPVSCPSGSADIEYRKQAWIQLSGPLDQWRRGRLE